ncbi:MAG: hypothetical protein KBC20_08190 [Oscillospiraceae bacterium]|nr:hypothetical protein [Oscillospiraceae bacterium]
MKKVLALALALIMVLTMGVTSFAITIVEMGDDETETDWGFTWVNLFWDVNNENVAILPYDFGDFATLIEGTGTANELFDLVEEDGGTLSSVKVESEKGLIDVTVYKLDDYVKELEFADDDEDEVVGIKTKSSWPFEDFDLEDIVPYDEMDEEFEWYAFHPIDGELHLDLYFVYFDFPTYAGTKVSMDNYFTLKFRENTTGADHVKETEKYWFCVYPWAVDEDDVTTYADEDEPMKLVDGNPMFLYQDAWEDEDFADFYEDVPATDHVYWLFWSIDPWMNGFWDWDTWEEQYDETPYVIEKSSFAEIIGSTLMVEAAEDLVIEIGKIVKGQSAICFLSDTDVDDDIQALDEDADLSALNFLDTTNVLDSDFTISYTFGIEDAAKTGDYFLYELVGDELKLVKKVAVHKGDDEVDVEIERKAGDTLGQYYLSDVELATTAAPIVDEENPNTGAAEVAGVAVALAVISLVSAAAVALKK